MSSECEEVTKRRSRGRSGAVGNTPTRGGRGGAKDYQRGGVTGARRDSFFVSSTPRPPPQLGVHRGQGRSAEPYDIALFEVQHG